MQRNEADSKSEISPRRISPAVLMLFCVLTLLAFSAVCSSVLLDMRRGEEALARRTLENLASSIDADIGRNIELYDLSLRNVAIHFVEPEVKSVSKPLLSLILFDHAATAQHFGAIQVFDAQGDLVLDSSTLTPKPENHAGEEYFDVHRDSPDRGLYISRPGLYHSKYSLVLSRRITGKDGAFVGVVVGSLRFSYFHDLFGRLQLQPDDTITVFRRDGVIIMRTPFDLDFIGKDLSGAPGMRQTLAQPNGMTTQTSAVDGIVRMFVWRDGGNPLLVVTGKSWGAILSLWRREAMRIGAIMVGLIVLVIAGTLFLAREINRRGRAEDRLEQLATTDALTQLKNRRKFDTVIAEEWRRTLRQGDPLALLMIDADHFKTFNDMFGHQAGDQVLVRIAATIRACVRRSADCAARYGGEEFAVLLPGLSIETASLVAEKIRADVERLSAEKWATTVSVGVAAMVPSQGGSPALLIEAADKALYEAKSRGRNQSFVAGVGHLSLVA
ncbi:MAG: sensor domain-containing diguanylate cyclase [Pseudomonadota bacterium]